MSTSTQKLSHELINIQVAIELDMGKSIAEVAEIFDLKKLKPVAIAETGKHAGGIAFWKMTN